MKIPRHGLVIRGQGNLVSEGFQSRDPVTLGIQPFTSGDFRQRPQDGYQVSLAEYLHLQDGEAGYRVVEGDPLNEAGEMVEVGGAGRWWWSNGMYVDSLV